MFSPGAFCTSENDCSFLIAFEIVRRESRSECRVSARHHHHSEPCASFRNASSSVRRTVVPADVTVLLSIEGKANREREEKTVTARKGKEREMEIEKGRKKEEIDEKTGREKMSKGKRERSCR